VTAARPVVGVVAGRHLVPRPWGMLPVQGIGDLHPGLLAAAGAVPVALPLVAPDVLSPAAALAAVDALVLTGGGDLDPETYGGNAHPLITNVDRFRDDVEITLFNAAVELGVPVLGVCRGMQVVNVALGGALRQDVPGHVLPLPGTHQIRTSPGSLTRQLIGSRLDVNSLHHQAVAELGHGLRATASSDDDVVEAFELPGRAVLGVQWHPELQPGAVQKVLFDWLVRSARP
jgi:putative glutamine amidotransferase